MKTMCFSAGILLGLGGFYLLFLFYGEKLPLYSTINPPETLYHHKPEGKKIQYIEYLDEDEFKSAEGNNASLYQLNNMCKLTIGMYGETIYSYRTTYFNKNRLIYMFETDYRTSYGQFPNQEIPESKRIYQEVVFNSDSQLVRDEFLKLLSKYITPENQKKC